MQKSRLGGHQGPGTCSGIRPRISRLHSCQLDLFLSRCSDVKRFIMMEIVVTDGLVALMGCTVICGEPEVSVAIIDGARYYF